MVACKGAPLSKIDGLPIAIKDNILVKGMDCTAASNILKGKKGRYSLTVVKVSEHRWMPQ